MNFYAFVRWFCGIKRCRPRNKIKFGRQNCLYMIYKHCIIILQAMCMPKSKGKQRERLTKKSLSKKYVGLKNQGATCYLNAVLQILFMTPEFRDNMIRYKWDDFHKRIAKLFESLKKSGEITTATTEEITDELKIDVHNQEDAAEFLQKILNLVCPKISETFQGEMVNTTICTKGHQLLPPQMDPFFIIPISLESQNDINVQSCFDSYFKPIITCGEDQQIYCNDCQKMMDTKTSYSLLEVPSVLVLHLERFEQDYDTMCCVKNHSSVKISVQLSVKIPGFENLFCCKKAYMLLYQKSKSHLLPDENQKPIGKKDFTGIVSEPKPDRKPDLTDQTLKKTEDDRDDPTELEEHHEMMSHESQTPKENKDLTGIVSDSKPDQKQNLNNQTLQKQQKDRDDPTEPDEHYEPEEQHDMMTHENQTPKEKKDLSCNISESEPDQKPDLTDHILQKQRDDRDDPTEPEEYHDILPHKNQTPKENKDLTSIISEPIPDQKLDLTNQTLKKLRECRDYPTEPKEYHGMVLHENQTPKDIKHLTGIVSDSKPDQKQNLNDQTLQNKKKTSDDPMESEEHHESEEEHEMTPHENQTPKEKDLSCNISESEPDQKPDLTAQTLKKLREGRDYPTEPEEYHGMILYKNQTSKDIKHLTNIVSDPTPDQKQDLTNQTLQKQQDDRDDPTEPEEHHDMMTHKYQRTTENKDLSGIVSEPKMDLTDHIFQKQQEDRDDPTEPEEQHEIMRHENQKPIGKKDFTGIVSEPKLDRKTDLNDQTLQNEQKDRDDPTELEEHHEMMPQENNTPKNNKDLTGIVSELKPDQKTDLTDQTLKKQQGRDDPTEPEAYHDMIPHENQTSKDIKHLTNIVSEVKSDQKSDPTDQTLQKQPEDRNDANEPEKTS